MQSALAAVCQGKFPDLLLPLAQLSEELGGLYTLPQIAIDDAFMVVNGRWDITKIGGASSPGNRSEYVNSESPCG